MPSPRWRGGLTLLEVMIALVIATVILTAFFEILQRARTSSDSAVTQAQLSMDANDLLQRIADELRLAGLSSPDWALGGEGQEEETVLVYNRCLGTVDGKQDWEAARSLAMLSVEGPEETLGSNGLDDNDNGLIDERRLVLRDPDTLEIREVWSGCLTSDGLLLGLQGNGLLTLTLSLQAPSEKPGGPPFKTRVSTDVSLRN